VADGWNQFSLVLGLLLGVAGLPHILIRFYTVKDAKDAKKGAQITIIGLAVFYIAVLFVGFSTMSVLYPQLIEMLEAGQRGRATNMAIPLIGMELGGEVVLGVIAAGAMAAMLSTSVGLLISMSTSLSHDVYAGVLRPDSSDRERVVFAKIGAGVLTAIALVASIWLKDQNVAVLVAMCFGIASSTFAPVLILSVWWKGLTKEGVIAGLVVGLTVSLVFTFARFGGVPEVFGIRVLGNPALYGVVTARGRDRRTSMLTNTRGRVDEFMAVAHRS
jgi:cation/acetate symporter